MASSLPKYISNIANKCISRNFLEMTLKTPKILCKGPDP